MKRFLRLKWIVGALLLTGISWPEPASAVDGGKGAGLGKEWAPVSPARLDGLRGGLVMPSGLLMSFGIERAVYVNGELVASTNISVPDVGRMTAEQARDLSSLQDTLLVQVGEGNTFVPNGMGGVVIQNTLNDQDIRALTILSVESTTLGMFQDLNANASLQDALNGASGGP